MRRLFITVLVVLTACKGAPSGVIDDDPGRVLTMLASHGHAVDASMGAGAVRYLGFTTKPTVGVPGATLTITHYWACTKALGRDYRVFVHPLVEGATGWVKNADHTPPLEVSHWRPGQVIADPHRLELPERIPSITVELRVGLFNGNARLAVDDPRYDDGTRRIRAGRIAVTGTPLPLPLYEAVKLTSAPVIDGTLDDAAWQDVAAIDGFMQSRGDSPSRLRTTVKLGWDDEALYATFDVEDPDIRATFTAHDAPIYKEEAVEMFIDAVGDGGQYIELQSSPRSITFDAAFKGGARRNIDVAYDADFTARCVARGTIDDASDIDGGWSCEWRIGLASIRGVTLPITRATRWRVNLFRIAKDTAARAGAGADDRVVGDESAWSPPLMGDFHNVDRFGTLAFRASMGDAGRLE